MKPAEAAVTQAVAAFVAFSAFPTRVISTELTPICTAAVVANSMKLPTMVTSRAAVSLMPMVLAKLAHSMSLPMMTVWTLVASMAMPTPEAVGVKMFRRMRLLVELFVRLMPVGIVKNEQF